MNDEKLKAVFEELDAVCKKHGVRVADRDLHGSPQEHPAMLMVTDAGPKEARFNVELCAHFKHGYSR